MSRETDRPLVEWARRLQSNCNTAQDFRQKLEKTLTPMIRCALRNGSGQPILVRWVQKQLPQLDPKAALSRDCIRYTAPMTRVLCEHLLAHLNPVSCRETVVGP
jgi:hypothetical protein